MASFALLGGPDPREPGPVPHDPVQRLRHVRDFCKPRRGQLDRQGLRHPDEGTEHILPHEGAALDRIELPFHRLTDCLLGPALDVGVLRPLDIARKAADTGRHRDEQRAVRTWMRSERFSIASVIR